MGGAPFGSTQHVQARFAWEPCLSSLLHGLGSYSPFSPFCVRAVSLSCPRGVVPLGLAGTEQRECLSTGRDGRGTKETEAHRFHWETEAWVVEALWLGVCVWFGLMLCVLFRFCTHSLLASGKTLREI